MYYIQFERKWKVDGQKKIEQGKLKQARNVIDNIDVNKKNRIAILELQSCFVNANGAEI